ncbi:hypothetical protein [Siphonobacter curvatus]|uniref:Uncharacterized protein n=1 Tax=Siphonobacter curvatus TaxID=2094562 RepID=A0A2S7IS43_9BACT|nr:hypothetical protein [Siphonobacter curvatus]PQA60537.1 hypothetical protein C5O19_13240 [Siphonobacter curvatus]
MSIKFRCTKSFCTLGSIFLLTASLAKAQEVNYESISFSREVPATLPALQQDRTYDVRGIITNQVNNAFISKEHADDLKAAFTGNTLVTNFGKLIQVDDQGDLHVIALIQAFKFIGPNPYNAQQSLAQVAVHTTVYDRYGRKVFINPYESSQVAVPASSIDFKNNKRASLALFAQKAITESLVPLQNKIYGYQGKFSTSLAYLDGVKKFPELKELKEEINGLQSTLKKNGIEAYLEQAKPYLSKWQTLANYQGEGNASEVIRAALQNLAVTNLLQGNYKEAMVYVEQYKPIDKSIRQMMGLISYKNSEELESMIRAFTPELQEETASQLAVLSTPEVMDRYKYYLIPKAKIVIESGRNAGTYEGLVKVLRSEPYYQSKEKNGMVELPSTTDLSVCLPSTGNGSETWVWGSTIKSFQDENGKEYLIRKFGSAITGGATYYLLQNTYQSPKLVVYQSLVPGNTEYLMMKKGDEKGVRSTLLNARKNMLEYLSDCPAIGTKYANSQTPINLQEVAEAYTACK